MDSVKPITVSRHSTAEERQAALYQIYQQILERQPYDYERRQIAKAERDFLSDKIGVRRFLKELGHSDIYLNSFYHNSTNLKFLEDCFKHFMGRAPLDNNEVHHYCNIMLTEGVHSMITAVLDSEEYRKVFGCFTVPYARTPKYYESPKAYLESDILIHEHFAQRGRTLPTLYWHQLGLNCSGGSCLSEKDNHSEANSAAASSTTAAQLQQELMDLLNSLGDTEAQKLMASLASRKK